MDSFNLSDLTAQLELAGSENPYGNIPNDCSPIAVTKPPSNFSFYMDSGSGCISAQDVGQISVSNNEYYSVHGRPIMSVSITQSAPAPFFIAFRVSGQANITLKYGWIVNKESGKQNKAISFDDLMKKVRSKNCSTETKIVMDSMSGDLESLLLGKRSRSFGKKKTSNSIKSIKNMLKVVNKYG
jgi:hypothetical protein